jgi:hypothetical protein
MSIPDQKARSDAPRNNALRVLLAWLAVGLPLFWGVEQTIVKALALFR